MIDPPEVRETVFGTPIRAQRPVLLLLVFGVFLVIVGVTASAQTVIVTANLSMTSLRAVVQSDAATVRTFANLSLRATDLDATQLTEARRTEIHDDLATLVKSGEILHLEIRRPDGMVMLSDAANPVGGTADLTPEFLAAAAGDVTVSMGPPDATEAVATTFATSSVLREYFPIQTDQTGSRVIAVVGIWRDGVPILEQVDGARRDVVIATLSAALVAAFVLFLVFRAAQARINRQTSALLEASRRDALTGTLNQGTVVGLLALAIEEARAAGSVIGLAVVDLDDFRLLNETYGYAAGDRVLSLLAEQLEAVLPPGAQFGRSGPDEFVVIQPADRVDDIEPSLERLRSALAEQALQFGDSEKLPVTISGGVCRFPTNGQSVTALLTAASVALEEARASGGDSVRLADTTVEVPPETRTFDVFQGLILAVDTKDRYTKRHSEDVSRYAVFLAERAGLDPTTVGAVRVAGLLHDVGKIGIPDGILRKPGKLTEAEHEIVKQHVALGDMILRDLPDIDAIRSAVLFHHERWDGRGYLAGLAGGDIPLIARILAVGDVFSAMTTSRPYRKALDVREALIRLTDAAGSQLDEEFVALFVAGIEQDPQAPMPGGEAGYARLWTPYSRVA